MMFFAFNPMELQDVCIHSGKSNIAMEVPKKSNRKYILTDGGFSIVRLPVPSWEHIP